MHEEYEPLTKFLPVKLSEEEVKAKAADLATTITDLKALKDDFDGLKKSMSDQIKTKEKEVDILAKVVRDKIENREVECYEERDDKNLIIKIIRADTYEVVQTRPMTDTERQMVMFPQRPRLVRPEQEEDQADNPQQTVTAEVTQETESAGETSSETPENDTNPEPEPVTENPEPEKSSVQSRKASKKKGQVEPSVEPSAEKSESEEASKDPVPEEL